MSLAAEFGDPLACLSSATDLGEVEQIEEIPEEIEQMLPPPVQWQPRWWMSHCMCALDVEALTFLPGTSRNRSEHAGTCCARAVFQQLCHHRSIAEKLSCVANKTKKEYGHLCVSWCVSWRLVQVQPWAACASFFWLASAAMGSLCCKRRSPELP